MKTFFALVYFYILVFCGSCFCQIMADWYRTGRIRKYPEICRSFGQKGQKGV